MTQANRHRHATGRTGRTAAGDRTDRTGASAAGASGRDDSPTPGLLRVGLTGPIAAGKSTVLELLARRGMPVFSADAAVHALYAPGGAAVTPVRARFPQAAGADGGIDRSRLAALVAEDEEALKALEAIVHPLVAEAREAFFRKAAESGAPFAVDEIPLLFETGAERDLDLVVAVVADEETARRRALARPGMTEDRLRALWRRHLPPEEKAARADIVIRNDGTLADLQREVDRLMAELATRTDRANNRR